MKEKSTGPNVKGAEILTVAKWGPGQGLHDLVHIYAKPRCGEEIKSL